MASENGVVRISVFKSRFRTPLTPFSKKARATEGYHWVQHLDTGDMKPALWNPKTGLWTHPDWVNEVTLCNYRIAGRCPTPPAIIDLSYAHDAMDRGFKRLTKTQIEATAKLIRNHIMLDGDTIDTQFT